MEKTQKTHDFYLAAYLALRGMKADIHIVDGKVSFNFPAGKQLNRYRREYHSNKEVPAIDYAEAIVFLRDQIAFIQRFGELQDEPA